MGLNAIGRGRLTLEDSTLFGRTLISFRSDYGSTWEGNVEIRNCRWIPACGDECQPHMINVANDGTHDLGYHCSMPEAVTIDGLFVDDANTPDGYEGMYYFTDPDDFHDGVNDMSLSEERPFPYASCRRLRVRGLETASGMKPRVSPNEGINAAVELLEQA